MKSLFVPVALASAVTASLAALAPAIIGPPMICHPFEIGDARTIALAGAKGCKETCDKTRLVQEVSAVLRTESDVIVRMETLRRAALAVGKDRALAWELLGRSGLSVLDQEAVGATDELVWFDTGFLVGCFDQLGVDLGVDAGVTGGVRGYGYVLQAIERAEKRGDPQASSMQLAAALMMHPAMLRDGNQAAREARAAKYAEHVRRAFAGAKEGSLLARNLAVHVATWGDPRGDTKPKTARAGD